jgi:hypothetical protein
MSEYQYYEFLAIDQPLDQAAQKALRAISSRAEITKTRFTNHYEWGDFKGDPRKLMERWFDLHLYEANWGTRRLMIRVPERFLKRADVDPFLRHLDWVKVWHSGGHAIVDIHFDEEAPDYMEDPSGRLAELAPLRVDVMSGDLRLFYLLWLTAVSDESAPKGEREPLPGIGPLTPALEAFAAFFYVDGNLLAAAAESGHSAPSMTKEELRGALAALSDSEKTDFLLRFAEGDTLAGVELKNRISSRLQTPAPARRTVGALRIRVREIAEARERAEAEASAADERRKAKAASKAQSVRLDALAKRGDCVWGEVEEEIERRIAVSYEKASGLLADLKALADREGDRNEFARRLASIRERHASKRTFIARLNKL